MSRYIDPKLHVSRVVWKSGGQALLALCIQTNGEAEAFVSSPHILRIEQNFFTGHVAALLRREALHCITHLELSVELVESFAMNVSPLYFSEEYRSGWNLAFSRIKRLKILQAQKGDVGHWILKVENRWKVLHTLADVFTFEGFQVTFPAERQQVSFIA